MHKYNLDGYKVWLLQNGRRESTAYRHINILKILQNKEIEPNIESLQKFVIDLKKNLMKHSYINMFIDVLRVYCRFSGLEEIKLKHMKDEAFMKSTLSDDEIEAFLNMPNPIIPHKHHNGKVFYRRCTSDLAWNRWTMFFSICAYSGMRPGEVAKLTVNDVDFGRDVLVIRESKTGKPRLVPIAPNIKHKLKSYIHDLTGDFLFPSAKGGKIISGGRDGRVFDSVDWHYQFHKRCDILGIKRTNLTPYSLRHSFITTLLSEDTNIFKVMKLVGHSRIETTQIYTHLDTKDIQQAIRKHPLVRKASNPSYIIQAMISAIKAFDLPKDDRFHFSLTETENGINLSVEINKEYLQDTTIKYSQQGSVLSVKPKIID